MKTNSYTKSYTNKNYKNNDELRLRLRNGFLSDSYAEKILYRKYNYLPYETILVRIGQELRHQL